MSVPLVSIIIPCYNAERWLEDALRSALAQTWPNTELVIVNDGSTDRSLKIARAFESDSVSVIDQPNAGASAARNTGLRHARGQFLQFLDADDLLAADKVEIQMRALSSAASGSIASGAWSRFMTSPAEAIFVEMPNWRDLSGVEFLQVHYESMCMMHPAAWLVPRDIAERAGCWDETLSLNDDGEYFARVVLESDRIVFCRAAESFYRSGLTGSLSGRADRAASESLFRSCGLIVSHLLARDTSERSRAAAAFAWKWAAFELYPGAPDLSKAAEHEMAVLGGSDRPLPAGPRFHQLARFVGWRMAKRLRG